MAFEVATYTDVTAGEAIDGVDGFNFQAVSPGLTGVDRQHIREGMLHRVVPSWALGNDALRHPPTCAFVVKDGRGYLSRGRSTGITNSGRPGNQVTQVIATSAPDDFVPYRPAQLYGALRWNLEKAPGPDIDPWVTPLEVRPEFEVDALQEMVTDDEWAARILPHYLTMVDEAAGEAGTKTVLLHTDLDVVMRWIALGTLFMDTERARTLQFRALVDDPWRVDAVLVGVSPEFGVGDLGSAHVLDLVNRTVPDIEPSEAARSRAALFVEHDAADALNAVETAWRWEAVLGTTLAGDAARLVGAPDTDTGGARVWRTAVSAIDRLAEAGMDEDLSLYGEELSEAAVTYGPTTAEEFALAGRAVRRTHGRGLDEVARGLLVPVLEALTAVPESADSFARELSGAMPPLEWESEEERAAAGAFLSTVLASAPREALPDLFVAARVIAAPVAEEARGAAVEELSALWLTEPELGRGRWQQWFAGREVAAAVSWHLIRAFRSSENSAVAALLRGDWDFLAQEIGDSELRGWVWAGKISRLPLHERRGEVATALSMPSEAWRLALVGAEVRRDPDLWASWISRHGYSTDLVSTLGTALDRVRALTPGREGVAADWGRLLETLTGAPDPGLARLADDYARAREALDAARREAPGVRAGTTSPAPDLTRVRRLAPFLLLDIGRLVLGPDDSAERARLVGAVSPWGPVAVRTYLVHMAERTGDTSVVEQALRLCSDPDRKMAGAADAALTRIAESYPRMIRAARAKFRLRGELDRFLKGRSLQTEDRRRGNDPFKRGRGK